MFAIAAMSHWPLSKGDIKAAFLQGDAIEEERKVYGYAPPELLNRLGVDSSHIV